MGNCEKRFLFITSAILSIAAFIILCISISGDKWLYCLEKMQEYPDNRTERYRNFYMGLWYVCSHEDVIGADVNHDVRWDIIDAKDEEFECVNIPYFVSDDVFDSGNTLDMIKKSIRKSTAFPFLSLFTLSFGAVVTLCGHCKNKGKKPLNFFSGIVFVSAGLLNLCGIIVFIASVTEEVGHKARQPRDDPALQYRYGWSIAFSALSFSLMEFAGAMFVYVYIKRFKTSFEKKQEHLKMVVDGRNPPLLPPPPPPFPRGDHEDDDEDANYHDASLDAPASNPAGFKVGGGGYLHLPAHDRQPSASATSSPGGGGYHPYHPRASIVSRSMSRSQDFLNTLEGGRYDTGSRHASLTRGLTADYNFVSREISRNTLSTTAEYNKDFSYDTLHRTTPI